MAEYIEREAISDFLRAARERECGTPLAMIDWFHSVVCQIPAADVVEVVRCKDCKYYDGDRCEHERHEHQEFAVWAYDNDFCSCGERKER